MSWAVGAGVEAIALTDSGFVTSVCDTGIAAGARVVDEGVTGARVVGGGVTGATLVVGAGPYSQTPVVRNK